MTPRILEKNDQAVAEENEQMSEKIWRKCYKYKFKIAEEKSKNKWEKGDNSSEVRKMVR